MFFSTKTNCVSKFGTFSFIVLRKIYFSGKRLYGWFVCIMIIAHIVYGLMLVVKPHPGSTAYKAWTKSKKEKERQEINSADN